LTSSKGLSECLVEPWSRDKLKEEVARLTKQQSISSPHGIQWTSIERDMAGASGMERESDTSVAQTLQPAVELDDSVVEYLKMLSRSRGSFDNHKEDREKLDTAIDGSHKLAQQLKFPAGLPDDGAPSWFRSARDMSSRNPKAASEFSMIRTVEDLSQVYGLSLMHPTTNPEEQQAEEVTETKKEEKDIEETLLSGEAKLVDAASTGQWGAESLLEPSLHDTTNLVTKLKGLNVSPLPPQLGRSTAIQPLSAAGTTEWRPKVDGLLAGTSPVTGHGGPVTRLAVSSDQRFFVSGSFDSTCRIWELGRIDETNGLLESSATYSEHCATNGQHSVRINDLALVEQSHSIASAGSDGSVHVWRVDLVSTRKKAGGVQPDGQAPNQTVPYESSKVSGCSVVKKVESEEGEVLAVSHYNTLSESVITYATQGGIVHTLDLRAQREPFRLDHEPELGYLTTMALGTDRNWLVTGTSEGYLGLWDVRFQRMVKLWNVSTAQSINSLDTSFIPFPGNAGNDPRPYVVVACGNDCGMYDLVDGSCRQSFRVLDPHEGYGQSISRMKMPELNEISVAVRQSRSLLRQPRASSIRKQSGLPIASINAVLGVMGGEQNFLITGGSDAHIRFWDFSTPSKCYTISGHVAGYPRPSFERVDFQMSNRLMVCRQSAAPRVSELESSRLPRRLQRGMTRPENRHLDSIQDLKLVQTPIKALVSCSRDGGIKLWR